MVLVLTTKIFFLKLLQERPISLKSLPSQVSFGRTDTTKANDLSSPFQTSSTRHFKAMSGRGRGRGRGRAPPTGARLLLQRSAQEAGLDAGNLRHLQDITRPQLFPDLEWHSNGKMGHEHADPSSASASAKRPASTVYLINKSREIHHRFQSSSQYVRPTQEVDVVRYGKRPRPMQPDVNVLESIGKAADPRYLPKELLQNTSNSTSKESADDAPKKALTLEELAAQELQRRKKNAELNEEDEDANDDPSDQEPEEDEEVADYTTNYYASDDESDGGGGGGGDEATF